ncbi:MAG: TIGR00341 family protein [bacterium]|nr:TIGR00341 family protein [bacterium]
MTQDKDVSLSSPPEGWRRRYLEYEELTEEKVGRSYYIMTALSAVIAVFGLLLNSAAVIIGAMLVAPLMTPILGLALGMTRGDFAVIGRKLRDIGLGAAVAILFATVFSFFVPEMDYGSEVLARTAPNLFDLAVAIASGIAGAYAFAHKDMSAALPGVAIAAALVPPLAVIGLALGNFDFALVLGSTILFLANIIAVVMAGALTFIAVGYFAHTAKKLKERRFKALLVSTAALVLIAVPMGYFMVDNVLTANKENRINEAVENSFPDSEGYEKFRIDWDKQRGGDRLVVIFTGISPPDNDRVEGLINELGEITGENTEIKVRFVPYYSFEKGRWK